MKKKRPRRILKTDLTLLTLSGKAPCPSFNHALTANHCRFRPTEAAHCHGTSAICLEYRCKGTGMIDVSTVRDAWDNWKYWNKVVKSERAFWNYPWMTNRLKRKV